MTKNLKLKIKNSQLAKAAGLDKLKDKLSKIKKVSIKNQEKEEDLSLKPTTKKQKEPSLSPSIGTSLEKNSNSPRLRIKAKVRSSFISVDNEDNDDSSKDFISHPLPSNNEFDSSSINHVENDPPSSLPSSLDTLKEDPTIIVSPETTSIATPPLVSTKNTSVTPSTPRSIIKEKYGPTGKHIKNLFPNTSLYQGSNALKNKERNSKETSSTDDKKIFNKPKDSVATKLSLVTSPNKKDVKKSSSLDFKDLNKIGKKNSEVKAFTGRDRYGLNEDNDDEKWRKKRANKNKFQNNKETIIQRPSSLKISIPITLKDLAVEMKLKASEIIQKMLTHGLTYVVNDILDDETTVQFIGSEFGCDIQFDYSQKEKSQIISETIKEEIQKTPSEFLKLRPPVIAFMGHVDHGKTSLIDKIRKTNLAALEAGTITQHIGAFCCSTPVGTLTILDTPGHEAFSSMRTRGAEICDIIVLVISGEEGIKEQTVEAIELAKNSNNTIVVAINKSDKPDFNPELVYRQLADLNLLPEAWGGSTITVNTSVKTGEGITELLEMLALQSEVLELQANPSTRARGVVIESELNKGLGHVATVLIQNGTLKLGDSIVFNTFYGKVKTMHNEHNTLLQQASPSTPVLITGLSGLPLTGDSFIVVKNEKIAKEVIQARLADNKHSIPSIKKTSVDKMLQNKVLNKKVLKLMIHADVQGSIEALLSSIRKIQSEKVDVEIISAKIGDISESDIELASASKAVIIGFHTNIETHSLPLLKSSGVSVKLCNVIYHAIDEIKVLMKNLLDPIPEEKDLGKAEIKALFKSSQLGFICGCQVTEGSIFRNSKIRIRRNDEVIWKGCIASLKRVKEDVKEVKKGIECGILLDGFNQAKPEDIIEAYEIIYKEQTL